ncbi:MAG: membrane protein insertion efficiency factor YidD [Nitrospirae bacterium]|nr:membrane protein insertion efficiency factor YidD [Nitrospirota bacterium]
MRALAICIIKAYKLFLSPFMPQSCRFYPSCSDYCMKAIEKYGLLKGLRFFLNRFIKCHPFHPGGYDPVPELGDIKQRR